MHPYVSEMVSWVSCGDRISVCKPFINDSYLFTINQTNLLLNIAEGQKNGDIFEQTVNYKIKITTPIYVGIQLLLYIIKVFMNIACM